MAVQLLPRSQWRGRCTALPATDESRMVQEESKGMPTGAVVAVIERCDREYVASFAVSIYMHNIFHLYVYVTVTGKTDYFVLISDFKVLVPRCSAHFADNSTVRFAITYTVPNVRESKYEHLILAENRAIFER